MQRLKRSRNGVRRSVIVSVPQKVVPGFPPRASLRESLAARALRVRRSFARAGSCTCDAVHAEIRASRCIRAGSQTRSVATGTPNGEVVFSRGWSGSRCTARGEPIVRSSHMYVGQEVQAVTIRRQTTAQPATPRDGKSHSAASAAGANFIVTLRSAVPASSRRA